MKLADTAIDNKVFSLVLTVVILGAGVMAFQGMSRLEDPEFTIKDALVVTPYPGATAFEVEDEVTDSIEIAVQKLGQLDEIESRSVPGLSTVTVTIKDRYDKSTLPQVWDELRRKVDDAQRDLPPGAGPSLVIDDFGDVYGIFFTVSSDDYSYAELKQVVDLLRRELLLVKDVAKVETFGERVEVVYIELDPRFSLSGFFAVSAHDVGDLFDGDSLTWGISLPIRWQLFDRGRIRSAIDLEQARTDQALVAYERTVLQAFAEVENALVAYSLERTRRDSLAAATAATQRAVELVSIQYQEGLADFQNVLDMERSLSSQQDQLAVSEGQILQDLIALYKALGGGWDPNQEMVPAE